jgi:hypothetical protein
MAPPRPTAAVTRPQSLEQLSPEHYHVEVDDGEDVLVEKNGNTPNFDLRVESRPVKAAGINMDRERGREGPPTEIFSRD